MAGLVPAAGAAGRALTQSPPASTATVQAHFGPLSTGWTLYEVDVELDPRIESEYDAWLPAHIDEILGFAGFLRADILVRDDVTEGPRAGWRRRTIQYRIADRATLDSYLAEHAPRFRSEALERFGEQAHYQRRTLTQSAHRLPGQQQIEFCQNCGSALDGQYCASCGQRARVRIISLWHLLREAAGDLTHLDSRLWRTIWPLLARPGVLTNEYLAGRRARYIPPFRLYLGLSIVFFVIASIGGGPMSEPLDIEDDSIVTSGQMTAEDREEVRREIEAGKAEAFRQLRARGIAVPGTEAAPADKARSPADAARSPTPKVDDPEKCDELTLTLAIPGRQRIEAGLRETCRSIRQNNGRTFARALLANIPKMMFFFLPLLALANKLLYPFSRRYYVEHLLFFVHFHAFAFLLFTLQALFNLATGEAQALGTVRGLITFAIFLYVPYYLYKAMRRVYSQGRAATLFKFTMVYVAYVLCMTLTLLGGLLYTALTL